MRTLTGFLVLAFCLAFCLSFASAHTLGNVKELYHGVQGAYEVWVMSRPTPVTGTRHLTVTVLRAADQRVVPGAQVNLTLISPERVSASYPALPGRRRHAFEIDAPLTQPGRWHLNLSVASSLGREAAPFSLRVFTPLQLWLIPVLVFATSVSLLALLGFGKLDFLVVGGRKYLVSKVLPETKNEHKPRSTPSV